MVHSSCVATDSSEWSFTFRHSGGGPPLKTMAASQANSRRAQSGRPPSNSATMVSDTVNTRSQRSIAGSWPVYSRQRTSNDHLIQTAEALEEQATSLRQLACRQRKQLIQLQQIPQPSNPDQTVFGGMATPSSGPPYHFDPSTTFPNGTLTTSLAPRVEGYGTWDMENQQQPPLQYVAECNCAGSHNDIRQQGPSKANSEYCRFD